MMQISNFFAESVTSKTRLRAKRIPEDPTNEELQDDLRSVESEEQEAVEKDISQDAGTGLSVTQLGNIDPSTLTVNSPSRPVGPKTNKETQAQEEDPHTPRLDLIEMKRADQV